MRAREFITESVSPDKIKPIVTAFIKFAAAHIGLDSLPEIKLITDKSVAINQASFGGYGGGKIVVSIVNRHINDVLRTLAHELVHYKQDINGELNFNSGNDGSDEENEANATAAVIMRKWNKTNPELMGLDAIGD